jgi:hypothetical protein
MKPTSEDLAKLIEHMLSEVETDLENKNRENEFIASLREQFDKRGELSDRQVEGIRKFYERV